MKKGIIFGLLIVFILNSNSYVLSQVPPPVINPAEMDSAPRPPALIMAEPSKDIPPIILIQGREKESFQKVFIEKVKAGEPINVTLQVFNKGEEELKSTAYGLSKEATYNFHKDEKIKNKATGIFTWTPIKLDKGFHTVVIEVTNSNGVSGRISLSYDVQ